MCQCGVCDCVWEGDENLGCPLPLLLCSFETGSLPEPEIHLFSKAGGQQTPVTLRAQPANGLGLWVPQGPGLARVGARI